MGSEQLIPKGEEPLTSIEGPQKGPVTHSPMELPSGRLHTSAQIPNTVGQSTSISVALLSPWPSLVGKARPVHVLRYLKQSN